jgi:hypothetical protein
MFASLTVDRLVPKPESERSDTREPIGRSANRGNRWQGELIRNGRRHLNRRLMTSHDEPTSCTKLVGPNPARIWMIGFEQNANCANLATTPTTKPPDSAGGANQRHRARDVDAGDGGPRAGLSEV